MKLIKKLLAIFFLLVGVPLSALMIVEIVTPNTTPEDKEGAVAALILFGLPPTVLGGYLSWSLLQQTRQEKSLLIAAQQEHLQLIFLELIDQNAGKITVLNFAKNAGISIESDQDYLAKKAKDLNADFEVDEQGRVLYRFS